MSDFSQTKHTILSQLQKFAETIAERKRGEFLLLPEVFDKKWGHWQEVAIICSTPDFANIHSFDDLPNWYQQVVKKLNQEEKGRQAEQVVSFLINLLTGEKTDN